MNKLFKKGAKIFTSPQSSIFSAATVIMAMVIAARLLGLIRQRVLLHFFVPSDLSLFFAAFRLPDLVFQVLAFGAFSSAFIPVFTKTLKKGDDEAWQIAGRIINIGLIIFIILALIFSVSAEPLYSLIAPGFDSSQTQTIAYLARVLFAAQGFFIISYVLTGALESLRRFLVPALAPIFYNLGIVVGTIILAPSLGLLGPALGVVIGASAHFLIQFPLAYKLGFRFVFSIKPNAGIKKIGRLAAPKVIELSFLQISQTVELYLASIITVASYTYYNLANSLQLLPVGLFGVSLAKAALPTLTRLSDDVKAFQKIFLTTLYQIIFLSLPLATILLVLRIPIVRLAFGTNIFDWKATVQTSMALSFFAISIPFQAAVSLMSRAFYALHDTKTPVTVSLTGTAISIIAGVILVKFFSLPVFALAGAYSIGVIFQGFVLLYLLKLKLKNGSLFAFLPILKSIIASAVSGAVMFFIIKFFDRSVWVKRLSFVHNFDIDFEHFVIDTRYTFNLLLLTIITATIGGFIYLGLSYLFKSEELFSIFNTLKRRKLFAPPPSKEPEPLSPEI